MGSKILLLYKQVDGVLQNQTNVNSNPTTKWGETTSSASKVENLLQNRDEKLPTPPEVKLRILSKSG